jgi:hypothetical protein
MKAEAQDGGIQIALAGILHVCGGGEAMQPVHPDDGIRPAARRTAWNTIAHRERPE